MKLRIIPATAALALLLAACGGSQAPAAGEALDAIPTPAVTVVPTPTPLPAAERNALDAVKAHAGKLGNIAAIGLLKYLPAQNTALVEVLFGNNVRRVYVATAEGSTWAVVQANDQSAALDLISAPDSSPNQASAAGSSSGAAASPVPSPASVPAEAPDAGTPGATASYASPGHQPA